MTEDAISRPPSTGEPDTNPAGPGLTSLDLSRVSLEVRSLVTRRRELMLFLGSLVAALGLYLQNVLQGQLPTALAPIEEQAFLTFSLALLVPAVLLALRLGRLQGGMVINGVFYAAIVASKSDGDLSAAVARAARLNWFGVSNLLALLTAVVAGFATALLVAALNGPTPTLFAIAMVALLIALFTLFHREASAFATNAVIGTPVEPFSQEAVEDHISESLRDANQDMIALISFLGLILFSIFESLSGLGGMSASVDVAAETVQRVGPVLYASLGVITCVIGTLAYLRLVLAVGRFSLQLDPRDRPFRLRLTDSFLGYGLLSCFTVISVHLLAVIVLAPGGWIWLIDIGTLALSLGMYVIWLNYGARSSAQAQA